MKSNRWITIAVYGAILGTGLMCALITSVLMPSADIDIPSPHTVGVRAYLTIGAMTAALLCPIYAGCRYWGSVNYLIASILALGLLLNFGAGIILSLISVVILYAAQRLWQIFIYFRS